MLKPFPVKQDANEDVVTILEEALELARNGEIVGVAVAMVLRGRTTRNRWSSGDYHMLNSAVARMACKIAAED
jgi:hypothetical protein